jgi:hypothetical protein
MRLIFASVIAVLWLLPPSPSSGSVAEFHDWTAMVDRALRRAMLISRAGGATWPSSAKRSIHLGVARKFLFGCCITNYKVAKAQLAN